MQLAFFKRKVQPSEFEAAAMPHLNDLYRTAVHLVRSPSDAQDLVQNVFLQAWRAFHRFEPGTNCRAWLFKILINEIRHYRRRWMTNKTVPEDGQVREETVAYEPPIPQELTDEDILQALEALPLEYREVVLLADVNDFQYKEIAETLGIPVGTVMSRLSRGRKQLRISLAKYREAYRVGGAGEKVRE